LSKKGLSVLVIDRSGVASIGGSACAGAFISPKIGKFSPLLSLTNEAFEFSKEFYLENFSKYFYQTGIIRIPRDDNDAKKFIEYEKANTSKRKWITKEELKALNINEKNRSFFFFEAGVCDAPSLCNALLEGIEYKQYNLTSTPIYKDNYWHIGDIRASKLLLATGYENTLFDMRYMGVHGIWGSRGDYRSSLNLKVSMHKNISISANINGVIKLGATHIRAKNPCMICDGKPLRTLEEKASSMVDTSDFELIETFCGMRSGSKDYFPLLGRVVDVDFMLKEYPRLIKGAKAPLKYIENLYICNGVGGRGFVFAPLMAKFLADFLVDNQEIDSRVNPDRLFFKWCRKLVSI
jgi:tRNA 5-methylaminomethyl-2-thiouridine biosynthesis bifunctional protein